MSDWPQGVEFLLASQVQSPLIRSAYPIDKPVMTIGRHPTNDITLPLESVSRFHARLELRDGALRVFDLDSSNGTFVNRARVKQETLRDQDRLSFGHVGFIVRGQLAGRTVANSAFGREDSESAVRLVPHGGEGVQSVVRNLAQSENTPSQVFDRGVGDPTHLKRARELLSALYKFHRELTGKTEESEIYQTLLDLIFEILPCGRGAILTREENEAPFLPAQTKYRRVEDRTEEIAISQTIIDRCIKDRVAVLSRDARSDRRFEGSESVLLHDIRSAMCAPLISRDRVWGICFIDTSEAGTAFAGPDLEFFAALTGEGAILIDNARMRRQMEIGEQMALIGQTITGMAHNIKNVLLLSQGGMELLDICLERKDYGSLGKTWDLIKRGLTRINTMVQEMLEFSRQRKPEMTMGSVNKIIGEAADFIREDFEKKSIALDLDLDETIPERWIDEEGFYRAFFNLLVNAKEAVEEGKGKVRVRARRDDFGNVQILVQDNGCGIPKEQLARVFLPFYTTKGSSGTGLGLPMTRKYIEAMGGRLRCQSVEGRGTVFEIVLHPNPAQAAGKTVPEAPSPAKQEQRERGE